MRPAQDAVQLACSSKQHETTMLSEYEALYKELMHAFFGEDSILCTMSLLLVKSNICMNDTVTDLLNLMLSEKMSVHLNANGFTPFKSEPMLYIDYAHCTHKQLHIIYQILQNAEQTRRFVACSHMNTGASIFMQDCIFSTKINQTHVLFGMFQLIYASRLSPFQKETVFNIIVQRLRNAVNIPHQHVMECRALCLQYKAAHATTQAEAAGAQTAS